MANIPVKWVHSGMRGAPVINGTAGALIAALKTFLITGFAPTASVSASVLDGIATIVLPAGQTFEEHSVVLLGGVLTGEERVLTSASDRITVATAVPNGPISGSITVRYAPVGGWEEVFSKTNVSVFRSTDITGSRFYLRVDDTGTLFARVRAYESMTDVDTGTGPFPTDSMMNGGGYWHKSSVASAAAAKWKMFADSKMLQLAIAPNSAQTATLIATSLRGFGDPIALSAGGDPFVSLLSVTGVGGGNTSNGALDNSQLSNNSGMTCVARAVSGLGGSVQCHPQAFTGFLNEMSGSSAALGKVPSEVDGQIKLSKLFIREAGSNDRPPRAIIPGAVFIPQTGANAVLNDGDLLNGAGEFAGCKLMAVPTAIGTNAVPTAMYLVNVTGPWRAQA